MLYYDVVVFGGDIRSVNITERFINDGKSVLLLNDNDISSDMLLNISCGFFILPVVPADKIGKIFKTQCQLCDVLGKVQANKVILSSPREDEISLIKSRNIEYVDLLKDAYFKHLNAKLTGEAAFIILRDKLGCVPYFKNLLVIGSGECASSIASLMSSYGANITVAARNKDALKVFDYCSTIYIDDLKNAVGDKDVIFNTVPALMLSRDILSGITKKTVIMDIASSPGGVDFVAAEEMGIDAALYPGLPGKYFPLSAGEAVYKAINRIMGKENMYGANG